MKIVRGLAVSVFALVASQTPVHADTDVVASIKPVHSLVAGVLEGVATPSLIVKGASSPHTYSLTPSQARALQKSRVVFWIGHELEAFLVKPLETLGADAAKVELMDAHGLSRLDVREGGAFEAHEHEHKHEEGHKHDAEHGHNAKRVGDMHAGHGHDHDKKDGHDHDRHDAHHGDETDPHVWLDPMNAKAMVHEIAEALSAADPKNASVYGRNEARLSAKLDALTAEVKMIVAPVRGKGFIVFHDAYQYFEHRFDIPASGSITVNPSVPPSVGRITEIRSKIQDLGASCVFAEPQFEPKIIRTVTEGTSAKTGVLDPLGAGLPDGPDLYFELIRNMAHAVKDCLTSGG